MVNSPVESPELGAHQIAYEGIKEDILSLRLAPHARLNAIELASRIGVSRTPVREALGRLEQEGLARREPAGGFRVHALTLKEIVDVYKVRAALEVEAAIEALAHLDENRLRQLEATLESSRAFLAPEMFNEFILANRSFHAQIVDASGNAILKRFMAPIVDRVRLIGAMLIRRRSKRQAEVLEENLAILAALRTKDPATVDEAVRAHVRCASEHAADLLTTDPGQIYIAAH